eukprot:UN10299
MELDEETKLKIAELEKQHADVLKEVEEAENYLQTQEKESKILGKEQRDLLLEKGITVGLDEHD